MARTKKPRVNRPAKESLKATGQGDVAKFIEELAHPLGQCILALRKIILGADKGITEHVKWNAPSFCIDGDDRVTFNLHKRECIMIVFHRGAKAKGKKGNGPFFEDTTGLLQWLSDERAIVKLHSLEEVKSKQAPIAKLVKKWMELTRP